MWLLRDMTTTVRVYRTTVPRHEDSTPSAALHGSRVALGLNRHSTSDVLRHPHLPTPPSDERITTPIEYQVHRAMATPAPEPWLTDRRLDYNVCRPERGVVSVNGPLSYSHHVFEGRRSMDAELAKLA
jgi:hypothetical protein